MNASEVRKANLRAWIQEKFNGTVADFCRYYQLPPSFASYLSQILNGVKAFGERAARRLEEQTGRPTGWLDQVASEPDKQQVFRYDSARCAKLPSHDRELVEQFIGLLLARHEASKVGKTTATLTLLPAPSLAKSDPSHQRRAVSSGRTMNLNERTDKGRKRRKSLSSRSDKT